MDPVITFDHVSFAYLDRLVLENVSFSIDSGEFIGVIGPNGGGKTTLLKLILGFLKPTSGSIRVFGKPPQEVLGKIAYVPQILRFDRQFPISVMELVLQGRLSHLPWYGKFSETDISAAIEALHTVGLRGIENRAFGTLSGGQIQRALIARALASHPNLLLLDEPTANVDSKAEADIYDLLQKLKSKMTILMVTHDLRAAIDQVERVLCVQKNVMPLMPTQVCEHFAFGLYHPPLMPGSHRSQGK